MLRLVALVRTDALEELSASIIRATKIGELGTKIAVTTAVTTSNLIGTYKFTLKSVDVPRGD
jgi:hypothetical protein